MAQVTVQMDSSSLQFLTDTQLLGISIANWLLALGVMVVSFTIVRAGIGLLLRKVQAQAQKPDAYVSHIAVEVLSSTSNTLLLLASILIGEIGRASCRERVCQYV